MESWRIKLLSEDVDRVIGNIKYYLNTKSNLSYCRDFVERWSEYLNGIRKAIIYLTNDNELKKLVEKIENTTDFVYDFYKNAKSTSNNVDMPSVQGVTSTL